MKGIVNLPARQTTLIAPSRRKTVSRSDISAERRTLNATARQIHPVCRSASDNSIKAPQGFVAACYARAALASRSAGKRTVKFDMVA